MTGMMRAGFASPNGLTVGDAPRPSPSPEQVLVRVAAAGMNRADLNAAKGAGVATAGSFGKPIGMEWAGEIVDVGSAVEGFRPGDKVMCSGTGGYAEYAVADAGRTLKLADTALSMEEAAVLPLVLMTAHDAVVKHGRLESGGALLVHGASSAVGLMAMQIARFRGARLVAGTSGNAQRRSSLARYGATHVFDPAEPGWADDLMAATGGSGVDAVVDMVSGPGINDSLKATRVLGRIVNVGRLGGVSAEFDFDLHAARRIDYVGVTFRTRSAAEVREIVRRMREDLWDEVSAGRIGLPIDRSFSLDDAVAAHEHMRANAHFGKIVLKP